MNRYEFKVIRIIDTDAIEVREKWKSRDDSSNLVRITELVLNHQNNQMDDFYKNRLEILLLDQFIELKNPVKDINGYTLSVFLNDVNIKEYFPEIRKYYQDKKWYQFWK